MSFISLAKHWRSKKGAGSSFTITKKLVTLMKQVMERNGKPVLMTMNPPSPEIEKEMLQWKVFENYSDFGVKDRRSFVTTNYA